MAFRQCLELLDVVSGVFAVFRANLPIQKQAKCIQNVVAELCGFADDCLNRFSTVGGHVLHGNDAGKLGIIRILGAEIAAKYTRCGVIDGGFYRKFIHANAAKVFKNGFLAALINDIEHTSFVLVQPFANFGQVALATLDIRGFGFACCAQDFHFLRAAIEAD